MREVHTELRLEHKVLIQVQFSKDSREYLILLIGERIVCKPFHRILAVSLP